MSSKTVGGAESEYSESTVSSYLVENPRMIGALFTILLLLSQVGNVSAEASSTIAGP